MIFEEKTVESSTVFAGKVFDIHSDKAKIANGEIKGREVVIHSGGVTIVAENNGKIILVKQYRYGAGQILIELPAGKLDHGAEDILSAAKRELEEETGYTAKNGHLWDIYLLHQLFAVKNFICFCAKSYSGHSAS